MAGAGDLLERLPGLLGKDVRVIAAPCIGRCEAAPAVCVGQNAYGHATVEQVKKSLEARQVAAPALSSIGFADYKAQGGYKAWADCVSGKRDIEAVIKTMEDSGLRGLGGAGFPV